VSVPESAVRRAVHDEAPGGESYAQASHVHARGSVSDGSDDALKLTERNFRRLAERWGQPIEEPADDTPLDDEGDGFTWRTFLRGVTIHLHVYRDPIPSMRAVRADYKTGLEDAKQQSASAVILYRAFGWPGQAWGTSLRFLAIQGDRPGRFAGFLFVIVLLAGSLAWALLL
jgi:hypothetical protein